MTTKESLAELFTQWAGHSPLDIRNLRGSGSSRKYFRLFSKHQTAVGVYHPDKAENKAFISFSRHFFKQGLPVPEIYSSNLEQGIYLLEDLGDLTLFDLARKAKQSGDFDRKLIMLYKEVIDKLIQFQITAGKDLDYSVCYPRPDFDEQSIAWDLNYFKYNFLKLAGIDFDEQRLEDDFLAFRNFLLEEDKSFFIYRDFQARNVMLVDHHPYFIDYQGGRRGPLQYDLASLLFQVRAEIPFDIREELLNYYIEKAGEVATLQSARFKKYYYGFVWLRLMQVMGAYGFRGLFEKKEHFIASIPYAVKNIEWLERHAKPEIELPEIHAIFDRIKKQFGINKETSGQETSSLSVRINSFAYKNGIPADQTDNGGGFVFDCRGLPNPGRLAQYKELTGKDQQVIAYLEEQEEVHQFLGYVKAILKQSVEKYMDRDFTSLMVNFGCTGGQHRSVFCAEKAGRYLQQNFPVSVDLHHREIL